MFWRKTKMISLTDSRRILGPAAQNFSDEEILRIRDLLHELAEIALEAKVEGHPAPPLLNSEEEC
jgi:hypothetical protein